MDLDTNRKLEELEKKIDQMYVSVRRIQFYFLLTVIITVAAIVLPLIGLAFAIPRYLEMLTAIQGF